MDIRHIEDLLREHPFFEGMKDDQIKFLAGCGRNVQFRPNETIFRHNTPADTFYILRSGRVGIEIGSAERDPITVQTLESGDVLGWSWLFSPYVWNFNAVARENTTAVAMDGRCLRTKIESDADLGYDLLKRFCAVVVSRLKATQIQLLDIYGSNA